MKKELSELEINEIAGGCACYCAIPVKNSFFCIGGDYTYNSCARACVRDHDAYFHSCD